MGLPKIAKNLITRLKENIFLLTITMVILYFVSGKISFYFSLENSIVTICIFFAEGISLASVIIFGKRAIVGVFIGQLLLALSNGLHPISSIAISSINSTELLIALYVLGRYKFDIKLLKLRDVHILFLTIAFVLQPFSSILGNIVLLGSSIVDLSAMPSSIFAWWFGNTMGQLLITPMILVLYSRIREINIFKTIWVVVAFFIFNYSFITLLDIENVVLLFSFMIPLVLLVSRNDGLYYASISLFVIAITSLYTAKIGIGIFANDTIVNNLININFYILAHILILYMHGVSMGEKDIILKKMEKLNSGLKDKVDNEVNNNLKKDRLMMQQSRLAQMGEAISMIAHQWRQPLNTLSLVTEGIHIKYTIGKLDSETMNKFNTTAQKQIQQMSNTIDDFRDFFKPEKERLVFPVDKTINHIMTILEYMIAKEAITLDTTIEDELYISGYHNELGQVLINIINNAKDALNDMPNNKERLIKLDAYRDGDRVYITIKDNAGGIPKAIEGSIFDPYFSTKTQKNGTGLGLYMSRIIIKEHMNGTLELDNSESGAKFILSFDAIR